MTRHTMHDLKRLAALGGIAFGGGIEGREHILARQRG